MCSKQSCYIPNRSRQSSGRCRALLFWGVLLAADRNPPAAQGQGFPAMWSDQFTRVELDPSDTTVRSLIEYDPDGDGPRPPVLAMSGSLVITRHVPNSFVAFFEGVKWTAADGPAGSGGVLACFDEDGEAPRPPALFSGGDFQFEGPTRPWEGIGRWDGTGWSSVGRGLWNNGGQPIVSAMAVYDEDGPGPIPAALIVSGMFIMAGGQSVNYIAKWDGKLWSPLGDGLAYGTYGLIVFDADGDGPALPVLVAGQGFRNSDGSITHCVSKWDGLRWSAFAPSGPINAFAVFDEDGSGPTPPRLFAGGSDGVLRWDGSSWLTIGFGLSGSISAMVVFDTDGPGPRSPELFVTGRLQRAGADLITPVAHWDGRRWSNPTPDAFGVGYSFATWDPDGPGPVPATLYLGGHLLKTDDGTVSFHSVFKLDRAHWIGIGRDLSYQGELPPYINRLASYDPDGDGPKDQSLIAGGRFFSAAGIISNFIAAWDGGKWRPLGQGLADWPGPIIEFDDDDTGPNPPYLYTAGAFHGQESFSGLVRWNGSRWSAHPQPLDSYVRAMVRWDRDGDGPQLPVLVAGGEFNHAGELPVDHIASWDGKSWNALESKPSGDSYGAVTTLIQFSSGDAHPALVVARRFQTSDGVWHNHVLSWDGYSWSLLGGSFEGGTFSEVRAFAVFDEDGSGPRPPMLFAAGQFFSAGDLIVNQIARWDGTRWSDVAGGLTYSSGQAIVNDLEVFDEDGPGPAKASLHAVGYFEFAGGEPSRQIARWDGNQWHGVCAFQSPMPGEYPAYPAALVLLAFPANERHPAELFLGGYYRKLCRQIASGLSALTTFPWIYEQPENAVGPPGTTAYFRVKAGGPGSLSYQWRRRGKDLIDGLLMSGSQTPTLILKNAKDPGPYDVEIHNECGPIVSQPARVIIRYRPTASPGIINSE